MNSDEINEVVVELLVLLPRATWLLVELLVACSFEQPWNVI